MPEGIISSIDTAAEAGDEISPNRGPQTRGPTAVADFPVYFLHIEKTAGTSVHKTLIERSAGRPFYPARLIDDLDGIDAQSLAPFGLFSGHFTGAFAEFAGKSLATVTLLRDPVQRSISHYAHVRRDPRAPHHELALTLSLREFCLHPETSLLIRDYQTRFLVGAVEIHPLRRVRLAPAPQTAAERAWLIDCARARLQSCAAVGVTEQLPATLALFCKTLGFAWNSTVPYENASYNRPRTIDRETLEIIRELTQCDAELHAEAGRMLRERSTAAGLTPAGPLAAEDSPGRVRSSWPARRHRLNLGVSAAIRKLPRAARLALTVPYKMYRVLIDRSISAATRLPLLLGLLYLISPIGLPSLGIAIPGHLDKAAALIVGYLLSTSLMGKKRMTDLKFAAISRFGL